MSRKYWGAFCPLPQAANSEVHEIYPCAWGMYADGSEVSDEQLDAYLDAELDENRYLFECETGPL